jgi:hypothetical protein
MYQCEYFPIEEKSFSHEAVAPLMENTKTLEQVKKNDNRKRHRPINGGETGGCWGALVCESCFKPLSAVMPYLAGSQTCPGKKREQE